MVKSKQIREQREQKNSGQLNSESGCVSAMEIVDNFLIVTGDKGLSKFELSSSRHTFGIASHDVCDYEDIKLVASNNSLILRDFVVYRTVGTAIMTIYALDFE